MRKLFVITISIVVLSVLLFFMPQSLTAYQRFFPQSATVTVFCRQTDLPCCDLGNGKLVQCHWDSLDETIAACKDVDGVSVTFKATWQDFQLVQQLLKLHVFSTVKLDNLTVVCGKSNKICGGVLLDGNNVNVQIAFDGETVTIGSPLILEGY